MEVVPTQVDVPVVDGGSGLVAKTIRDQQHNVVNKIHKMLQVVQVEMVAMVVEVEDLTINQVQSQVQLGDQVQHLVVVVDLLVQLQQVVLEIQERQVLQVVSGVLQVVIHQTQVMGVIQEQRFILLVLLSQVQ